MTDPIVSEAETTISTTEKMGSAAKKIVFLTDPIFSVAHWHVGEGAVIISSSYLNIRRLHADWRGNVCN